MIDGPVEFRLLGPLEVARDGVPLAVGGRKQRALLVLLLLNANEVVSRGRAIEFLWGERPPERAVNALQVGVHGLRQLLGADRIVTRGSGYLLRAEPEELDLLRFTRLREEGQDALAVGDAARAAERLCGALGLWRGEPLADLALESSHGSEWAGLEELRLGAVELRIEADLALGLQDGLIAELEALIGEHPFRERLRAQLMVALYRSGRQAEALEAYQAARRMLGEELGIEPSPFLRELERAVLRQDPSLGLPGAATGGTSLPRPVTRLVGRRLEVASVCSMLRDPEVRLLTLTGPGGVGKTRLAIEAAAELSRDFEHGAVFVDLAPLADAVLVESTLAAGLGVVAEPGETIRQQLIVWLCERELLLVLDNFERLLPTASLVAELLAGAPRLRVLITSRVPLRLTAEHEYLVPPLAVPSESGDLVALARNDSVTLFLARARAIEQSFLLTDANADAVAAICRRLEGVPLALELAAARIKVLTPAQILARLAEPLLLLTGGGRDLPARQQALRATIDWSYELLGERERWLFARLAVFAGGCTLESAEAVCDSELESFAALLDGSLVRRQRDGEGGSEPRFGMLDTIREYAVERLDEQGAEDARRRHAQYFTALAERIGPELVGRRSHSAVDRLAREHENLRAALAYALRADHELGFRLTAALRPYWDTATRGREIRVWLEQAFCANPSARTPAQVGALVVLGRQRQNDGEYEGARAALEQAVEAAGRLDCPSVGAIALTYLAWLSAAAGEYERSLQLGKEAVDLAERGDNAWAERQGLAMVAGALINLGDYKAARSYLARSLALARRLEDVNTLVLAMVNSGYGAICAGELTGTRPLLEEALRLCREPEWPVQTVPVLHLLAWEANASGDPARARPFLYRAISLLRTGGQLAHRIDVLGEVALTLELSTPHTAARLLGATDANHAQYGIRTSAPMLNRYRPLHARLATKLGEDELTAATAAGALLELDDALAEALAAVQS